MAVIGRNGSRCVCVVVQMAFVGLMIVRVVPMFVIMMVVIMRVVGMIVAVTGSVIMLLFVFDNELCGGDTRPQDPPGRHRRPVDREAPQRTAELFEGQPRVEQRAEHHIARGTGETIEI